MIFTILFALSGGLLLLSISLFIFYKFLTVLKRYMECPHCKGHIHKTVKVGKFEYIQCCLCFYPNLDNEYENKLISLGSISKNSCHTISAKQNPILIQNMRNWHQIEFTK
jgi:hypothetical protein